MTMPGFIRQNRPQDGLKHSWAAGSPQGFETVPQRARQLVEEHRAMAGLDDSDASTVKILRQFVADSSWSEELKRVWRTWLANLSPSDAAAALFEAELTAGRTPDEAKARLNRDRHLCEAVRADWRGHELAEPAVTTDTPVNEARRRAIARALGLPESATLEQIGAALDDFGDEELPGIAAALRLPESSSREDIKRTLQKFLRTESEPSDDPDEPVVWAQSERQRVPVPRHGYKGIRKLLAEQAHCLADERQIPFTQALSEIVARDPSAYDRALREF
jgi:hypothetical protein